MSFEQLPKVLKSVVCEFAFACNWAKTDSSLKMCEKIASYNISPVFLRSQMWSWSYGEFLPTPLDVFLPIHQFTGRWSDIVDWHAVRTVVQTRLQASHRQGGGHETPVVPKVQAKLAKRSPV